MELFKSFISFMAYASLGFSFAAAYLKTNKIWKRKHIAEVANSVSILGNVFDINPLTFFSLNFLLVAHGKGLSTAFIGCSPGQSRSLSVPASGCRKIDTNHSGPG